VYAGLDLESRLNAQQAKVQTGNVAAAGALMWRGPVGKLIHDHS